MKRLMTLFLIPCILIGCIISACAEEETPTTTDNTFDLSSEQQKIAELGIPTVSSVATLKSNADALWEAKDYSNAAVAYANYAEQVNWLANIISGGLEPYYGASYDDKESFSVWSFGGDYSLISAESTANSYKGERNRAMVYEGLCFYNMNDYESALPLLLKALDLIEISDTTNWQLAMNALYSIVGY